MELFPAELAPEAQVALIRQNLRNLITSYSDEGDVFTELIQNAIDAIELRHQATEGLGELTVVIGRRSGASHYVYVQDNGVGMSEELLEKIFIPGFSWGKAKGSTIGYKGVGVSYLVAVSTHIAVVTVDEAGQRSERTIRHAFDWVTDADEATPQAQVEDRFDAPSIVSDLAAGLERGTGVFFAFHPGHKPATLTNTVLVGDSMEQEINHWISYLAARTPIGLALEDGQTPPRTAVDVRVVLDRGKEHDEKRFSRSRFNRDSLTIGYPFPHRVFAVATETSVITGTPVHKRHVHDRKHQAVYHFWSAEELLDSLGDALDDDERAGLAAHLDWVCGYLAYSTDVLKKVNEIVGARSTAVRYGGRLCVDGSPQGRPLDLALTSDQGLDRQTHIVLGFNELELDTGRKFISDEKILSAVNKVNQRVVSYLKDFRWALKKKDLPDISSDLDAWIADVQQRSGNSLLPALYANHDLDPVLEVDPSNEQEVIALWVSLLAGGLLKGFQTRAISGYARYDSLVDITDQAVGVDLADPLAPAADYHEASTNSVLEFKFDLADLIKDFQDKKKAPSEVDMVVAWDCSDLNLPRGDTRPVYGKWRDNRPVYGCSYVWEDDSQTSEVLVICLRNVVAELLVKSGDSLGQPALDLIQGRDETKLV